jgi:hypothetical protein
MLEVFNKAVTIGPEAAWVYAAMLIGPFLWALYTLIISPFNTGTAKGTLDSYAHLVMLIVCLTLGLGFLSSPAPYTVVEAGNLGRRAGLWLLTLGALIEAIQQVTTNVRAARYIGFLPTMWLEMAAWVAFALTLISINSSL